uniref:Transcription initiation factor TFIID subunit 13 n=1 Tax=Trichobilharzia regenti TaxID=157069 RepID=A0AA85K7S2_TRIRE|nr:unnamed protein product [Trichobilharzia regenti]
MGDLEFTASLLEDEEEQDATYDRGKKRMFTREIRSMLYAFGDDENPLPETVSLVEDIAVRHILEMNYMTDNLKLISRENHLKGTVGVGL